MLCLRGGQNTSSLRLINFPLALMMVSNTSRIRRTGQRIDLEVTRILLTTINYQACMQYADQSLNDRC